MTIASYYLNFIQKLFYFQPTNQTHHRGHNFHFNNSLLMGSSSQLPKAEGLSVIFLGKNVPLKIIFISNMVWVVYGERPTVD